MNSNNDASATQTSRAAERRSSIGLVLGQLTGNKGPAPGIAEDRRNLGDRRRLRSAKAFVYGNFRPRRRASRRDADQHVFLFDWHESHILYVALGIVLLSCVDALFTLNLLKIGAEEVNFVMNRMISMGVEPFLWTKLTLTNLSVVALVTAAQKHFLGWIKVVRILQIVFAGYLALICYEIYLFTTILGLGPVQLVQAIFG